MKHTPSLPNEKQKWLDLSLATGPSSPPPMPPPKPDEETSETASAYPEIHQEPRTPSSKIPRQQSTASASGQHSTGRSRSARSRRSPNQSFKRNSIIPPYPWATTQRAKVHTFEYLMSKGITKIKGEVKCKRCEKKYEMEYDLEERFSNVANFIVRNKHSMYDRAPRIWKNPTPIDCMLCGDKNCVTPTRSKKRSINWLFLLLGLSIGYCKLSELKYFCKHTDAHRTGAKDRLIYLTYIGLCKQLDPLGPFDP